MSRYGLTKIWILVALLPLTSSLGNNSQPTVEGYSVENFTDAIQYTLVASCEEAIHRGLLPGVYHLDEPYLKKIDWIWGIFEVYCDRGSGAGWTVIQRRGQFGAYQENFKRFWDDYAKGFGDLNGEFWLGNEWIHRLTSLAGSHRLRIEMEDMKNQKLWAEYSDFRIEREVDSYKISVSGYTGNAGNGFYNRPYPPTDESFVTYDRDPEGIYCSEPYSGGWWGRRGYPCLSRPNLNGPYNWQDSEKHKIQWIDGLKLKSSKMMIRSKHYRSLKPLTSNRL